MYKLKCQYFKTSSQICRFMGINNTMSDLIEVYFKKENKNKHPYRKFKNIIDLITTSYQFAIICHQPKKIRKSSHPNANGA